MENSEKSNPEADLVAEARAVLAAEEQKEQAAFVAEINEVCKKYGFNLQAKAEIVVVKA